MAYVTAFEGILFIEGVHPRARIISLADVRVSGFGAQLRNLNDLKQHMATEARSLGCNCVMNFTYGQKAKLIAIDDVSYVGSGQYVILDQQDYNAIVSQL